MKIRKKNVIHKILLFLSEPILLLEDHLTLPDVRPTHQEPRTQLKLNFSRLGYKLEKTLPNLTKTSRFICHQKEEEEIRTVIKVLTNCKFISNMGAFYSMRGCGN